MSIHSFLRNGNSMQDEDFEPVTKEVAIPRNQLERLQASLKSPSISSEKLLSIFLWLPKKLISWWQVLHSNQKLYFLAVVLGISQEEILIRETMLEPNIGLLIVGSIAMIGMLRELLDIFTRVWQTLLGKSFIFIIYVIIGNFTLAVAARKVNYITGVDPHSLIYAQGFTTVLVLPLWLLLLTSMSLILLFTLGNLWFLFLKLINVLRLHPIKVRAKERFSILFIFIRLMLIPPVMVTLMQPLNWYNNELNIEFPGLIISPNKSNDAEDKASINDSKLSTDDEDVNTDQAKDSGDSHEIHDNKRDDDIVIIGTETNQVKVKYTDFDRAIAAFVFEYETFQLSRCEKADTERVSIIGEDIILVAEKIEGNALGYKFSSRACILRDYK
jgi:hypothetical protein